MNSLDKKSLYLLAGVKRPLNENMSMSAPVIPSKIPASIHITADSGDEVSVMMRCLAAMSAKETPDYHNYPDYSQPGDHIDRSNMVKMPSMSDLVSKIDQYEEIKDGVLYDNAPAEIDMARENFPATGDMGNPATTAAGDTLVTAESLMKEYYNFLRENETPPVTSPRGNAYSKIPTGELVADMTRVAKELGVSKEEINKVISSDMEARQPTTPYTAQQIKDIYLAANSPKPSSPAGPSTAVTAPVIPTGTFESLLKRIDVLNETL